MEKNDWIKYSFLYIFSLELFMVWKFKSAFIYKIEKGEKTNGIFVNLIICENHYEIIS